MGSCIVIGGGFAGLSSAVYLSEKKINTHLIESSPKLGGRAYSLLNEKFNDEFDNGQHILMGCYDDTLEFLDKIDTSYLVDIQKSLSINFVKQYGIINKLEAPKYFYPFNLLIGILNYKSLSLKERIKIVDFFLDLACCFKEDLKGKSIKQWLDEKGQSVNAIKSFWEILVGALNTNTERASAGMFAEILKRIFFNGSKSASIVIPKVGLSKLYVEKASQFIRKQSGTITTSERVLELVVQENKVKKIITDQNEYIDFNYVVSAIPPHALDKLKFTCSNPSEENLINRVKEEIGKIEYSSILNIHLWLKENPFKQKFYGLIGSSIHWVFNHGKHISLTTSNANEYSETKNDLIVEKFCSELEKYFPIFKRDLVVDTKVIKEKRATFIPDTQSEIIREKVNSPFTNFILPVTGQTPDCRQQ
jgi:squalene-associated FAD-dependent desaturase